MAPRSGTMRPLSTLRQRPSFILSSLLLIATLCFFSTVGFMEHFRSTSRRSASSFKIADNNPVHTTTTDLTNVVHHQAQQLSTIPSDAPTVVFYHIFIPQEEPKIAMDIVKEQVKQFGKSYAASTAAASWNQTLHVQYVTIGRDNVITEAWMNQTCHETTSKLRCTHVKHAPTGFEEITLSAVHDFCLANPEARVTYIHNKGSYHARKANHNWRYALTEAALSQWCINGPRDCNICGLQFYTIWAPFLPGNMWTANCSYVRKLLTPVEYERKTLILAKKVFRMRLEGRLQTEKVPDVRGVFGLGRFASELWAGSHPTVKPCDCDPIGGIHHYKTRKVNAEAMSGALAPRHVGQPALGQRASKVQPNVDNRMRDYFLLPGNLMRWYNFYGEIPDNSSWAWTWFPDGDFWQKQTTEWGADAVDIVTRRYTSELLAGPAAFVDTERSRGVPSLAEPIAKNWNHAIYYDFHVSQDAGDQTYLAELALAAEQLRLVDSRLKEQGRQAPLFYRTMGHRGLLEVDFCGNTSALRCRRLGHEDAFYAGETLLDLRDFCQRSPNSTVSRIHNIPPRDIQSGTRERTQRFLRHATMASMSNECLLVDGEKCNLCGLAFYTEPKLAMAGDMWTASCSYINRLHSPVYFQEKMANFIDDVLVMMVFGKLEMGLFAPRLDVLGLNKYAVEHWVGSHPSLLPCDVSPRKFHYWLESEPSAHDHSLGLGPRHRGSPFSYNQRGEAVILGEVDRRRREFYFLPGQLEKWYHLYSEVPINSSWVWSWFSEGSMWLSQVSAHGSEAVNIVTDALAPQRHQE